MRTGKLPATKTEALLGGSFGAADAHVLLGPGAGLDAAVVDLGGDQVLVIAEDPIFPAPGLPLETFGQFTVHIGASDVAVTGVKPRFMTYTLLLPPGYPEAETKTIITAISNAAAELEIAIVGGHTGWYGAVTIPTIGGVTVWGTAGKDEWISPGGARDGDVVLLTKGPAIEATALLAVVYKEKLKQVIDHELLQAALARTKQITVVKDALTAFRAGGVHAMHDATEGGVLGGLCEMAFAARLQVHADLDRIVVPRDITAVSAALDFDPWLAISEGTLLAAVDPQAVSGVQAALQEAGIESFVLGTFDANSHRSTVRKDGVTGPLREPETDPFWQLFFAGL